LPWHSSSQTPLRGDYLRASGAVLEKQQAASGSVTERESNRQQ
jgi:hypothetical protein